MLNLIQRTIVVAIDPTSALTEPLIRWTLQNLLQNSDTLHIITGVSLDPEFDALDFGNLPSYLS